MTDIATRPERITVGPDFEITTPPVGTLVGGEPVYLVADNPWLPWANRAAGAAMGTWTAAIATLAVDNPLWKLLFASAVAMTLLFAWVLAGHELFEKRPTRFKKAP